jgi:serine/threonine protein kinase
MTQRIGEKLKGEIGTKGYMAFEIVECKYFYGGPADIYSLAMVLFACLTGKMFPCNGKTKELIMAKNFTGFWEEMKIKCSFDPSDELKQMLQSMILYGPNERPSVSELLNSDWFCQQLPTPEEIIRCLPQVINIDTRVELKADILSEEVTKTFLGKKRKDSSRREKDDQVSFEFEVNNNDRESMIEKIYDFLQEYVAVSNHYRKIEIVDFKKESCDLDEILHFNLRIISKDGSSKFELKNLSDSEINSQIIFSSLRLLLFKLI